MSCLACGAFVTVAITTGDRSWGLLAATTLPVAVALGALFGPVVATADRRRRASA